MIRIRTLTSSIAALTTCALFAACAPHATLSGQAVVAVGSPKPVEEPPAAPTPPLPPPPADEPVVQAAVEPEHDVLKDKIQFDENAWTIKEASNGVLDRVAETLKKHSEIKKLQIQGHASAEGNWYYNLQVSDNRAKAVKAALIKRGVPADALSAKALGDKVPVAPNTTEDGRQANRRVEFVIVDNQQAQ